MIMLANTQYTWHVSKLGNDSNDGRANAYPVDLAGRAKLTIGAAISAASSGDTIVIWPGTYSEAVDTTGKVVNLIGLDRTSCAISGSGNNNLILSAGSNIENMTVTGTGSAGIRPYGNNKIEDCTIFGTGDGIYANGDNVRIYNCDISSNYDVVQLGSRKQIFIDRCNLSSDGTYGASAYTGIVCSSGRAIITNSTISMATSSATASLYGISSGRSFIVEDCTITLNHTGSVTDPNTYVTCGMAVGSTCNLNTKNCNIYILSGRGNIFGIRAVDGKVIADNILIVEPTIIPFDIYDLYSENSNSPIYEIGCCYNKTKTYGTIYGYLQPTTFGRTLDVASTGEAGLDFSNIRQATSPTTLSNVTIPQVNAINDVALKILRNKAVQNKTTGQIKYYDDDGETVILTHTPEDNDSEITRTPS